MMRQNRRISLTFIVGQINDYINNYIRSNILINNYFRSNVYEKDLRGEITRVHIFCQYVIAT